MKTSEFDFASALRNLGARVISKAWIRVRCRNRIIRRDALFSDLVSHIAAPAGT